MNSSCHPQALAELLNAEADGPEHDALTAHVSQCLSCQKKMEDIAAGPWWWTNGRDWLAAAEATDIADDSPTSVLAVDDLSRLIGGDRLGKLDFLDPAHQPELLGQLGKYQIESVIGQGGMGIVLKGFDRELNRTVAIKVLAPHLASSGSARQRFAREARAAAAVVHDHVVAIYGIETENDLPYLVMPFVGGASLRRHIEQHGPARRDRHDAHRHADRGRALRGSRTRARSSRHQTRKHPA